MSIDLKKEKEFQDRMAERIANFIRDSGLDFIDHKLPAEKFGLLNKIASGALKSTHHAFLDDRGLLRTVQSVSDEVAQDQHPARISKISDEKQDNTSGRTEEKPQQQRRM